MTGTNKAAKFKAIRPEQAENLTIYDMRAESIEHTYAL